LRHGNCVEEEKNLGSEEMEGRWTVADPEEPLPKFFWKILSKSHAFCAIFLKILSKNHAFCAKFSLVLRCIRSIGGRPPSRPPLNPPLTVEKAVGGTASTVLADRRPCSQ